MASGPPADRAPPPSTPPRAPRGDRKDDAARTRTPPGTAVAKAVAKLSSASPAQPLFPQVFSMTPTRPQALVTRSSPISAVVQSAGGTASVQDLLDLGARIRNWVREQMQSQSVQTCTLFHRAQEAGKALEDKINDAQSRMAVHLQQTSDASRVLEALIGESQDLRTQLQLEVRQIAEHFEDKLQSGGEAIVAKDIELRTKVEVSAAGLESVGGRLNEHETDLQGRVAALEVFSDQHSQLVQTLCQAIDTNYQQLEDRVEARLNEASRHSGVQELFGQFQVASQEARDGIATLQARFDHLEASGSKGPPASADAPLAFALQALQVEVTDLGTHVARALSLSEDAAKRPGESVRPEPLRRPSPRD